MRATPILPLLSGLLTFQFAATEDHVLRAAQITAPPDPGKLFARDSYKTCTGTMTACPDGSGCCPDGSDCITKPNGALGCEGKGSCYGGSTCPDGGCCGIGKTCSKSGGQYFCAEEDLFTGFPSLTGLDLTPSPTPTATNDGFDDDSSSGSQDGGLGDEPSATKTVTDIPTNLGKRADSLQ